MESKQVLEIKAGAGSLRNSKRKPEVLETMTSIQQNSPIKKLKIIRHNDTHVAVQQHNKDFVLFSLKDHPGVRSCGRCPYQFMKSYLLLTNNMVHGGMHKPEYYEDQTILPIGITTQILTVFVRQQRRR